MKNLKLLYNRVGVLKNENSAKHIDLSTEPIGTTFIATDTKLLRFDWNKNETSEIAPIDAILSLIGFQYLLLNNELCVATEDGDVIVHNLDQSTEESVTFCDGGLKTMSWSHDQEVVAFVTKTNLLVVMNSAYDAISETRLLDDEFGAEEFMNVGWGKKETQFHGSEGKAAAHKKPDEIEIDDISQLDQEVSIVWRGDDELFAVSFVGTNGRMFKVFDKEGKLKYTSEKCSSLDAAIAWRPSGNWIAVPNMLPNKYTIALFEKNGLRHREIVLPFKRDEECVKKLQWSADSEILAIYTEKGEASTVYLYTICNYHWYQKQTMNFSSKCHVLLWDTNHSQGNSLHVIYDSSKTEQNYIVYR